MYPPLAPRACDDGAAHGAAGVELISLLEEAAYGKLRPTLVALQLDAAAESTRRYNLQLRNLARLSPDHLGVPAVFCPKSGGGGGGGGAGGGGAPSTRIPYAAAGARLQQLPQSMAPHKGLMCLVDTCHRVAEAAEELGAPPPAADELVPLTRMSVSRRVSRRSPWSCRCSRTWRRTRSCAAARLLVGDLPSRPPMAA